MVIILGISLTTFPFGSLVFHTPSLLILGLFPYNRECSWKRGTVPGRYIFEKLACLKLSFSILIHDSLTDWIINSGGKPFPLKVLRALFFCFLAFAFATWGRSDSQSFRVPCCCYCYFSSSWNFGILSLPLIFYIFKIMGFSTTLFLSLSWASHHLFKFRILCPSGLGFFLNRFYFCLFVYFFTFAFPGTHWLDLGPYRWNLLCLLTFLSKKVSKLVLSKCRWKYVYLCVCVICKAWRVMRS